MYVFENNAFIAHPRAASRACGRALQESGFEKLGHHCWDSKRCQEITESGGQVACVIRNPFDIVVSWYFNSHFLEGGERRREGEFEPWVKRGFTINGRPNPYMETRPYFYGLMVANVWIHYANLNSDLFRFMRDCGVDKPGLTSPYGVLDRDRDYRVYYNDETRDIVQNRFAVDLQITGYTF